LRLRFTGLELTEWPTTAQHATHIRSDYALEFFHSGAPQGRKRALLARLAQSEGERMRSRRAG